MAFVISRAGKLCGACLTGHSHVRKNGIGSRPPFHGGPHTLPHQRQSFQGDRKLTDDFRAKLFDDFSVGANDVSNDLWLEESSPIGDSRRGI